MSTNRSNKEDGQTLNEASRNALRAFAEAPTARERLLGVKALFDARQMAAVRRQPEWEQGLSWCAGVAADRAVGSEERMFALAALVVPRTTKGTVEDFVARLLPQVFLEPIPPLDLLRSPDDRERVLAAIREMHPSWGRSYAMPHLISDAARSKSRREALLILLDAEESLEGATLAVAAELEARGGDRDPAGFARLTTVVLSDLEEQLSARPLPPGDEPARGPLHLAEILRRRDFVRLDIDTMANVSEAVASLVRRVAASRLRLAFDARSYEALVVLAGSAGHRWTALFDRSSILRAIADDVAEALFVHAKTGVPDPGLRRVLETLSRSPVDAALKLEAISREPGVPHELRRWLADSEQIEASLAASVEALNADSERDLIAVLAAAASDLEDWLFEHPTDDSVPRNLVDALSTSGLLLAGRRRMRVAARPGDVVTFDPTQHEVVEIPTGGLAMVRVKTPVIVQDGADGIVLVVRKGLVTPA